MAEHALQFTNVTHRYGEVPVVSGVELTIEPGRLCTLLGASGSGKSTLLRCAAGFVTPTEGTVHVNGQRVAADGKQFIGPERRGIGVVFQEHALFAHMSVARNVGFGLADMEPTDRSARVRQMLDLVGLRDKAEVLPALLSGGQRQRIALARALAPRPRLLLLDEPFASLDAGLREKLASEIRGILRQQEVAALLVTHDHRAALGFSDQLAVLSTHSADASHGVVQIGTPEHVYAQPANAEVAALTGSLVALEGHAAGQTVTTAFGTFPMLKKAEGEVRLLARPHQFAFEPSDTGPCRVIERSFQGATSRITVEQDGHTLTFTCSGHAPHLSTAGRLVALQPLWSVNASTGA